ncbi:hypothetical protein BN7_4567 [Wickerhamomyces ciferrii]|uniref:Uncharacterized protein n=1 Tax=Wickerhamomyces ciferrii (strain ATCC 14091 / BCRC 22168 / CBS 111 / JCM 3599 / NBRC 0793 / NRRL Y-1031 F-60-10) TaxID=1206466 RepID=K0KV03_WICCF|nr:uncharacterized protein BN7_4567 [Wickerhamomyces ciferrii]CCH44988.1 hypothetical protein BN7_4567 [Wickerhamomyces ciferrii]
MSNTPVSKHSRAARRNEIDDGEVKSLSSLPRAEKTDLTSAIIRATTKKNEDLLNDKMKKKEKPSSITKDLNQKAKDQLTNLNKSKMEKAIMQSDILQDKILKSKQRSKYVQTARKQNWDAINQAALAEKARLDQEGKETKAETPQDEDEDAMEEEEDFFNEGKQEPQQAPQRNVFDLLNDEVEC